MATRASLTQINLSRPGPAEMGGAKDSCAQCPIRDRAICSHCNADEMAHLEQIKFYRSYPAGQLIQWEGERSDFVASVVTGVVTLTRTLEDGRTQMVGLLMPSDFLGRPGRDIALTNATAATDVTLCCFRRAPFDALMRQTPHLTGRLLEMTQDELDAAREWMLILGRKSARERIASFLVIVARRHAMLTRATPASGMAFDLPLSREAMADYLGLTLETVSRQINALKREGLIDLTGKRGVILHDVAQLIDVSGEDGDGGWPD